MRLSASSKWRTTSPRSWTPRGCQARTFTAHRWAARSRRSWPSGTRSGCSRSCSVPPGPVVRPSVAQCGLLPLLMSRKDPEDLVRATAPFLSATPIPETDGRFPGHARAPRNKPAIRRQLAAQLRYSSLRRLHTIRQPTLVMHGEKDRLVSPLNARRMTRRIPGARLRLIVGAGHLHHRDRPRESRDLLLDFLMEAAGRLLDQEELQFKRGAGGGVCASMARS